MSDFLGNLAMKSLGLAPLVQPRPLSQFEALPAEGAFAGRPAAEAPAASVDLLAEEVSDAAPARPSTSAPSTGRSGRLDTPPTVSAPRAQVERPAPLQPLAVSLPQVASQAETIGPALQRMPAPKPTTDLAPAPLSHPQSLAMPAPKPPTDLAPAPLSHPQALAMPAPALFERSPWTSPRPVPASQLVGPPSAPAPLVENLASESHAAPPARRIGLTPEVEQIKPSPLGAPAESRTQPAGRAEPSPTISVTIGRVEVRAALSPETSTRRTATGAKPAASISLNDYLRLRSGGKP